MTVNFVSSIMNIATDVVVTPSSLNRTTWTGLKKIAAEGSQEQQETLLAWSYSAVPAALSEELHFIVYGWEEMQRRLGHEMKLSITEMEQAACEAS